MSQVHVTMLIFDNDVLTIVPLSYTRLYVVTNLVVKFKEKFYELKCLN